MQQELKTEDATFLLTVGSSLLTAELFSYSCVWELFCLQIERVLLTIRVLLLTVELLCLQWESLSKKHLNGL